MTLDTEKLKKLRNKWKESNDKNEQVEYFKELTTAAKILYEEENYTRFINCVLEMKDCLLNRYWMKESFGWEVYNAASIPEESHTPEIKEKTMALIWLFPKLKIEKSSLLNSLFLMRTSKMAEDDSEWYLQLLQECGFDSLREEDFKQTEKDGKQFPPLASSVYKKAASIIEKKQRRDLVKSVVPFLSRLIKQNENSIWEIYALGKLKLLAGEKEKARKCFGKILPKKKNEFWMWQKLAASYTGFDDEIALGCLSNAVLLPGKENMKLRLRTDIANFFIARNMYPQAKTELNRIVEIRNENNFKVPDEITNIMNKPEIKETEPDDRLQEFYEENRKHADKIYSELLGCEETVGIIESIHSGRGLVFIKFSKENTGLYKVSKKRADEYNVGGFVKIRYETVEKDGEQQFDIISADIIEPQELSFVMNFDGTLRKIKGKDFGFVEDIFINPELMKQIDDNTRNVEGIAINAFDKKKQKYGWKALTVTAE